MKEIVEKLRNIKDQIVLEKAEGQLRFLGLIARTDLDGKWDLLLSADWIKKSNGEEDLIFLIQKLKKEFQGNLDFLSKLVLLTPSESFILQLARAIVREDKGKTGEEISDLKISVDFTVRHLFVISFDFAGIDLEKTQASESEPIATEEVVNF